MPIGIFITIFIFVVSFITLINSIIFTINPQEFKLTRVKFWSFGSIYASVLGFLSGVAITLKQAITNFGNQVNFKITPECLRGLLESLVPVIIAFTLLSISWVVMASGVRRIDSRKG